jgi:hypothetical protein
MNVRRGYLLELFTGLRVIDVLVLSMSALNGQVDLHLN